MKTAHNSNQQAKSVIRNHTRVQHEQPDTNKTNKVYKQDSAPPHPPPRKPISVERGRGEMKSAELELITCLGEPDGPYVANRTGDVCTLSPTSHVKQDQTDRQAQHNFTTTKEMTLQNLGYMFSATLPQRGGVQTQQHTTHTRFGPAIRPVFHMRPRPHPPHPPTQPSPMYPNLLQRKRNRDIPAEQDRYAIRITHYVLVTDMV